MGLSLNQVRARLALALGTQACPSRPTSHRRIKAAGLRAGRVLKSLDAKCQALVLVGCLDEIFFHGRPVLVGVEPASMAWFLGQKADDRPGATGAKALRDRGASSYVTADAGTGPRAGIAAVQQERQQDGKPSLEKGLDVFPTTYEARRVLRSSWDRVGHRWEPAEVADRRVEPSQRRGQAARGAAVAARGAGKKTEAALAEYERSEAGGKIAHGARAVFRPEGQFNGRAGAEQEVARALPLWSGRAWSEVRGFLPTGATWTFLDRLHRQWREAVPEDRSRAESVRWWWLRRRRPRANTPGGAGNAGPVAHLVRQVVCHKSDANWRESYAAVSRVLRRTVRASSAVECRDSVLRMHPSRHRTVTRGLLDRKRLYGNCRAFREGKRRRHSPDELLGWKLPSYRFWDLLGMPTPAEGTT